MSPDPYTNRLLDTRYPCAEKSPVSGELVCVLDARSARRGLVLSTFPSRAVLQHEIHELILTSEPEAAPGQTVNQISYLGYFEVSQGGVLWVGDRVVIAGIEIGVLAGYDLTHFPNHMNLIIKTDTALFTGFEAGFHPGVSVAFIFPGRPTQEEQNGN